MAATIPLGNSIHPVHPSIPQPTLLHQPSDPPVTTLPSPSMHTTSERGDIAISGLFDQGTNAIMYVCITTLDSTALRAHKPLKNLQKHEADKRSKYWI